MESGYILEWHDRVSKTIILGLSMVLALAATSTRAEVITVGPAASGCNQANLALAFIRASVTPESDTIMITSDLTHTGGTAFVLVDEAPVTFRGVETCTDFAPTRWTITATVGDLFAFTRTNVGIRDLVLRGDTAGRPLAMTGAAVLTLEDALVTGGRANDGANIHLSDGASVVMFDGSSVTGGLASFNGGGIYCVGPGTVGLLQGARIQSNRANFNGGGIYAAAGCTVNHQSGGLVPNSLDHFGIAENVAGFNGGGIYATSGATVLASGTSERPASIRGNDAEGDGGGIFLTGSGTTATISSSEIAGNLASSSGGGVYVTSGADFLMDRDLASCARGHRCSLLEDNGAGSNGTSAIEGGGAVLVTGGGQAEIRQTYITDNGSNGGANGGGNVALVNGAGSFLLVEGSVLYDNDPTGTHVAARSSGLVRLGFISAWGSSTPGLGTTFAQADSNGRIELFSSIVIEGRGSFPSGAGSDRVFGTPGTGATYLADCVIAHETGSFPAGASASIVVADPAQIWEQPAMGDSHLLVPSEAVDYCDLALYAPVDRDIDDEVRGFQDPDVGDRFGPFDLGADESQGGGPPPPPPGLLFRDGFESSDTSAWSATVP